MNNITYKSEVKVMLNGKHVGTIKEVIYHKFQYFPKNSTAKGEKFPTLEACKKSLEE